MPELVLSFFWDTYHIVDLKKFIQAAAEYRPVIRNVQEIENLLNPNDETSKS